MREIKLKAWSKSTECFVETRNLRKCFDEKLDCVQFEADESVIIPLQFIGRQDKNGKDIYEYFIVRFNKKQQDDLGDWIDVETTDLVSYDIENCEFVANRHYADGETVDWSENGGSR